MRIPHLSRRSASIAAVGAVLAPLSLALPGSAGAAGIDVVNCAASITYEGSDASGGVTTQAYTNTFSVSSAAAFSDDRSTVLREEIFQASVVGGTVEVSYVHDVGVFDDIVLNVSVPLRGRAQGRSHYGNSLTTPQAHATSYTISCRR